MKMHCAFLSTQTEYIIKYYDPLIPLESPFLLSGDIGKIGTILALLINPDEQKSLKETLPDE